MNKLFKNITRFTTLMAFSLPMINSVNADPTNAMTLTTNDVFWSSSATTQNGMYYTEILRRNKDNVGESQNPSNVIFRQEKSSPISFNSLVQADVAGIPYLYYVVNFDDSKISYINRIPATGGPVTNITRPLYMGKNDLKTDGAFLYWIDREAIRKIPVNGGTATILARVPQAAYVKQVALDRSYVYFNAGASGESIYRVPKAGGAATIQAIASSTVTDLVVHQGHSNPTIYWSEINGAVKSYTVGANTSSVYQNPTEDRKAVSIDFDGIRVLWADCLKDTLFDECFIKEYLDGAVVKLNAGYSSSGSIRNIAADPAQVFWTAGFGVDKYVHPAPLTVSISPSPIYKQTAKPGVDSVRVSVKALVSGGSKGYDTLPDYYYSWSISDGSGLTLQYPRYWNPSIFAAMPDGDSREGELTLTVTDMLGRTKTVQTSIKFENPVDPGQQPK
jgi:hypothetical protein